MRNGRRRNAPRSWPRRWPIRNRAACPTLPDADEEVRDVLDTFATIADLHPESLGAYVISMAQAPSDVLAVAWLQRLAGSSLRIVPLFEQVEALHGAADDAPRSAGDSGLSRPDWRSPGSDGRLLRFRQGRWPAGRELGALHRAGTAGRGRARRRHPADACSTAAAAASAAAAARPTSRSSRSRPARSTDGCGSPNRAR